MLQRHMRNPHVAEDVRAQLHIYLERMRSRLGLSYLFVARVAGGERRIDALAVATGHAPDLVVGQVAPAGGCEIVKAAARIEHRPERAAHLPKADGPETDTLGITVVLTDDRFFGVIGGQIAPEIKLDRAKRSELDHDLRNLANLISVGLDVLFDHEAARQRLRGRMGEILSNRSFHAVFQPVVDVVRGEPVGYEGLTRLDKDLDITIPSLVEAARQAGMVPDVEIALAREIMRHAGDMPEGKPLSVNLCETTILSDQFFDFLEHDLAPGMVIELTEHEPIRDYVELSRRVAMIREKGMKFAVDDAGAGYTSLSHILNLKPDIIKLDAILTERIDQSADALAMFKSLQQFCDATDKIMVIEGVERASQLDALKSIGVRYVQGYHFGKPARWGEVPEIPPIADVSEASARRASGV